MNRSLATLSLAAVLAGCASPDPRYFLLTAPPVAPSAAATPAMTPGAGQTVVVKRLGMPDYLDRPEIVRSSDGTRVEVTSEEQWAESLQPMIERVFTQDLGRQLPGAKVVSEDSAIGLPLQGARLVQVQLQRFHPTPNVATDPKAGQKVVLEGQVAVGMADSKTPPLLRHVSIAEPVRGKGGTADLVQAMDLALAELAHEAAPLADSAPY